MFENIMKTISNSKNSKTINEAGAIELDVMLKRLKKAVDEETYKQIINYIAENLVSVNTLEKVFGLKKSLGGNLVRSIVAEGLAEEIKKVPRMIVVNDKFKKDPRFSKYLEDEKETLAQTGKISQIDDKKIKKFRTVVPKNGSKFEKFVTSVMKNMRAQARKMTNTSIILTGDPGTGKTSSIKMLANLLGLEIITIEAPHLVEEHIINVPIVVSRGTKEEKLNLGYEESEDGGFELVTTESNLVTILKKKRRLTDAEWQKALKSNKNILMPLYKKYEKLIKTIREQFFAILFVDEFYRTGNKRIQNLMRGILNGHIGKDTIPPRVYIIYASNMNDEGLDEVPLNNQFQDIEFNNLDKDDWFAYIKGKFVEIVDENGNVLTDEEIKQLEEQGIEPNVEERVDEKVLNPTWFNNIYKVLDEDDLGKRDTSTDVRLSPRRMEEIIKYVSANTPPKSKEQVRQVLTYLKTNFYNYLDNTISAYFYIKFADAYLKTVEETSDIDISDIDRYSYLPARQWKEALANIIETSFELGDEIKYPPVILGAPGIGKTTHIKTLVAKYKMNLIVFEAPELNPDDVIGIPLPGKDNQTLKFTKPPLYDRYKEQYDNPDEFFERAEKVPITKEEVRTIQLSKARLKIGQTVYDIGCGSGSISVEASFQIESNGKVLAIDYDENAIELTKKNLKKFNLSNVSVIFGNAKEKILDLEEADVIFIGTIRDLPTMSAALRAAEMGILVFLLMVVSFSLEFSPLLMITKHHQ